MKLAVLASYREKPPALREGGRRNEEALDDHHPVSSFTAMGKKCSI
jgi:hypothetical protein